METSPTSSLAFSTLFGDPAEWQVFASGQAKGMLSKSSDQTGIRLDYDFHDGGGFVVIRRVIPLQIPNTFEIGFQLRGQGPDNHFEFKVASPGGANVWRHLCQSYQLPSQWTDFHFNERELPFAWGPDGGGAPSAVEAVEIVIAAGPGGKGFIELSHATLDDQTMDQPRAIIASSYVMGHSPEFVFAGGSSGDWCAAPEDPHPWWLIDFGQTLRFGGLVIDWPENLPPRAFDVEISHDGEQWETIYRADRTFGAKSHIATHGAQAAYLRITFQNAECAAMRALTLKPDAFSSTPNEFMHSVAADYPRGWFPRYWYREQSYWTCVGSPEGKRRALINEEGMVETDEGGFSLEPFILTENGILTWADAQISLSMEKRGAPMPRVRWKTQRFQLDILPWVDGKGDELTLRVTYQLTSRSSSDVAQLVIAVRPYQVNPPWQAFRNLGGRSPIHHIARVSDGLRINDRLVLASPAPDQSGAAKFEEGGVISYLENKMIPPHHQVDDSSELASAAMAWNIPLDGRTLSVTVSVPYFGHAAELKEDGRKKALAQWRRKLALVKWHVPASAQAAFDCMRCAAGHILINRDGPAIQPGPRRYTRSWVRDCVIMGEALIKVGVKAPLRQFLTWYAPFQRDDGFIPCVVDRDGVDWLVEHDSHGQFIWGVREVMRQGGDSTFLAKMLPHVAKAADYLIQLREQRMTVEFVKNHPAGESHQAEHTAFYGLLPESASHEGYLAHPVHSYWDDFWGVRGLEAAADLALSAGHASDEARWRNQAHQFQDDMLRSISQVIAEKQLAYIPGSVEWADFDPTATSNALALLDFADALPEAPLHSMLETYIHDFRRKHHGDMPWNNYTAYEIRIIGAFVRLGKREIANELLEFFLSDRRPVEWNQWPEITWRDPRSPGHLGDVPHTWIAAEYILALLSMVAAEREATHAMVLASGMPWAWIAEDDGFAVENLVTQYGPLNFRIAATEPCRIHVSVGPLTTMPPGGLRIAPPLPAGAQLVHASTHDGQQLMIENQCIQVMHLPCEAVLHYTVR